METKELVQLKKVNYYKSSMSTEVLGQLNGKYYLWNNIPRNDRIRVTKNVKDCEIKNRFAGWVLVSDLVFEENSREITQNNSREFTQENLHESAKEPVAEAALPEEDIDKVSVQEETPEKIHVKSSEKNHVKSQVVEIIEIITYQQSLMSICYKYYGSYDKLPEIMKNNNFITMVQPIGTPVKLYIKKD